MKNNPIDDSLESFLQGTMNALKRAGKRARRVAEKTGTCMVVDDGHGVVRIRPKRKSGSKKP
jgi:hypothetical protein